MLAVFSKREWATIIAAFVILAALGITGEILLIDFLYARL
jgi:hypothetical protein